MLKRKSRRDRQASKLRDIKNGLKRRTHRPIEEQGAWLQTVVRAKSTTAQMTAEGTPVRYLRSTFIPGEEKCYCLFEGPSEETVREANERSEIPLTRVSEVMHIASEDLD